MVIVGPATFADRADSLGMDEPGMTSPRVALFDFDGTLSLIRSGWQDVMIPMMMDALTPISTGETAAELRVVVDEYVWRLTGKETIYQMMELTAQVEKRTGQPSAVTPIDYKREYLRRLEVRIENRVERLRTQQMEPDELMVPGSRQLLEKLRARGVTLVLASGTDDEDVRAEAALLQIDGYFLGGIFGAKDDMSFSKAAVVRSLLEDSRCKPSELLGFGDGYVEIEEVKKAGGFAVGIATAEPECLHIDEGKRRRLLAAGADIIIANFLDPRIQNL